MNNTIQTTLLACVWLFAACSDGDKASDSADAAATSPGAAAETASRSRSQDGQDSQDGQADRGDAYKTSSRNLVQWKRAAAIEADLAQALELDSHELCNELGDKSCIRDVHLVPLGGNEPYVSGLMKPSVEPLATTPAVIDRVLLSACGRRAQLDAEGDPKVFKELKFEEPLPAADDDAVKSTVVELYRRLLARDPRTHEVEVVSSLADKADDEDALSTRDFATLACFTIGSSTEFLFF